MKKQFISWNKVEKLVEKICLDIQQSPNYSNYKNMNLIIINRGGLVPGRLISDFMSLKQIYTIDAKLYKGINIKANKVDFTGLEILKNIYEQFLIVDDIVDSGETMSQLYCEAISRLKTKQKIVKTAALYWRSHKSCFIPEYYGQEIKNDNWLVFPWEKHEFSDF